MDSIPLINFKSTLVDVIKDSPILLYAAFYHPVHDWLVEVGNEWNPILQLFINIFALWYGVYRLVPIYRSWRFKRNK
jgi:hypothetical protein